MFDERGSEVYPRKSSNTKSIDTLAREVLAGNWGNGQDRKNRLTNAGYNYDAIQNRVNEILSGNLKSIDDIASENLEEMMNDNYKDFIKVLVSIEKGVNDEKVNIRGSQE